MQRTRGYLHNSGCFMVAVYNKCTNEGVTKKNKHKFVTQATPRLLAVSSRRAKEN